LDKDPLSSFLALNEKGSIVTGTVQEVDAKGAVVILTDGVEGYLRASELSRDRVEDARSVLKEGETIDAKFTGVDRKNRTISLSIKAKDYDEEKAAIATYSSDASSAGTTAFGDLLKDQLNANKD
jgi:small subunit ribosomal protein S1